MKLIKLITLLFAILWLAGCNTLGTKPDGDAANGSDVVVEDRSVESSAIEGNNASGTNVEDGAETKVVVGEQPFKGGDVLDDPNSPLANRVVYFDYDSSSVRQQDVATLEAHAAYLGDHPNVTIRLIGNTDERGSREYNLALGERRAISVRQILMLQGASIKQFEVTSFGEERPAVEGSDETAWQQNRRVEIIYVGR